MKSIAVTLLVCFLIAFAAAADKSTIKLDVFHQSSSWMIAVAVRDADVDTRAIQIKQSGASSWEAMEFTSGWGYFISYARGTPFKFPMSVRLTAVSGKEITLNNVITSFSVGVINTRMNYDGGVAPATSAPATTKPTAAAATKAPTKAPTAAPTKAATKAPATKAPTAAATTRPTTKATTKPTTRPTAAATVKPTVAPTTKATVKPTTAPSSGCNAPLKMLVPLYMYPGAQWDTVLESAKKVETVAIINPSSGPGTSGPSNTFKTYMAKFDQAGIEMIGYVHTSYGARSISDVKKEIDEYASKFTSVVGIFLDEASANDAQLPYYRELHTYIMNMPGWKYNVINPGAVPTAGYLDVATQIVSFETDSTKFATSKNPSYASCANKDKFSVITYGATASSMRTVVDAARSKGYYGWVYTTADSYTKLPSFYADMAQYIADGN